MRCLLLAVVAGLAVFAVQIRAQEAAPVDADPVGEHSDDAFDDDEVLDIKNEEMARMLADLFDDGDFAEAEEEHQSNREARARGENVKESVGEEKAVSIDAKDQARYNNFMDTFLRRLNLYARSQFDPLVVGLSKKDKKGGKPSKSKDNKKKRSGNKGKKSEKKPGKDKKKGKHPRNLNLDEVDLGVPEVPEVAHHEVEGEEPIHEVEKREVEEIVAFEITEEEEEEDELEEDDEVEEESLVRVAREAEEEDPANQDEVSRRGKPAKSKKKGAAKKGGKKGGKKKKGKGGKKNAKKAGKKGKKPGKKGGKKSKRSTKGSSKPRTSRATVKGIASLQRQGDVIVVNKKGGKEMRAKFTLGPVELSMNRKFGQGKSALLREAKATTPEITGKLSLLVSQSGKAKVTNLYIARPSIVQVDGTIHKTTKGGKNDNNFMENSLNKISPIASKKLKIASRKILSAGEAKSNTEM